MRIKPITNVLFVGTVGWIGMASADPTSNTATGGDPVAPGAQADPGDSSDVVQELQNPVADLVSIPIQSSFDMGIGSADDNAVVINIQPVVPIKLAPSVNLITRTILPIQSLPVPDRPGERRNGFGDVVQSLFFSPVSSGGLIWGVGPVQLLPTASQPELGAGSYGLGPTGVVVVSRGTVLFGMLANHLWSVSTPENRPGVSVSFVQPFLAFSFSGGVGLSLSSETSYNWKASGDAWTIPLQVSTSKLVSIGGVMTNLAIAGRIFADSPSGGPDWGLRVTTTFVLPSKKSPPADKERVASRPPQDRSSAKRPSP